MGNVTEPVDDERRIAALLALYRAHGPQLFAFAYRLCGSRAIAEDVVQEAFVRAMTSRVAWCSGVERPDWRLFGFVRNVAREQRRRTHREHLVELLPEACSDDVALDATAIAVRRAVLALDEADRAVLVLAVYHGYRATEIAQILDVSAVVIRVRLFRARRRLRTLLEGHTSPKLRLMAHGEHE